MKPGLVGVATAEAASLRCWRKLDARRLRQKVLIIGSGIFLVAMTLMFYAVLAR